VGRYHHRMPVILHKEDEAAWLNPDTTEPADLLPLLKPFPAEKMEEWQVDGAARNPRNDRPEVMQRVREEPSAKPEQGRLIEASRVAHMEEV
jgi:putative SOS response-associated peptidase YedK